MRAPFPWFGGKSRAAALIWERFGDVPNYVEPFAGSLAVLLARPHEPGTETVNDLDCYLANFWRAAAADPDAVWSYADSPVNEADLSARHQWLVDQAAFRERMTADPHHYDAKIAGWWVWGLSAWIGSGWCVVRQRGDGRASAALSDLGNAGMGVHRQLPHLGNAGMGVHRQLPHLGDKGRGNPLSDLADRLRRVRVACGDWRRVLGDSSTWRHGTTAVLLDPPYADGEEVYSHGEGRSTFADVATWAAEHGADARLRIALCGYEGTWEAPDGWVTVPWKAHGGYGSQRADGTNENAHRERIWFSPGCLRPDVAPRQVEMFSGAT